MSNAADKVSLANQPNRIWEKYQQKTKKKVYFYFEENPPRNRRVQEKAFKSQVENESKNGNDIPTIKLTDGPT